MKTNYELIQAGFRELIKALSGYIGQTMSKAYRDKWWDEVLLINMVDKRKLPVGGNYGYLVDSLDIANCIRVIDRKWFELYSNLLDRNCRTWANELMGVRNDVSHKGASDCRQAFAERALDTMALLCHEIDPDTEKVIRDIYSECREKADGKKQTVVVYDGVRQPEAMSERGSSAADNLLKHVGTKMVQKTKATRKITFNGETKLWPVYKVRLDKLYYNDQNDRIATWISRYDSENENPLSSLNSETYNGIIEEFICESNVDAIGKTQRSIEMRGQDVPGVALADGRIVDGNRRYTCLRRLQRNSSEPLYFETVIMEADIVEDRKQIKLLELSIQHGEEKKVDYDPIDYAIGTYRTIKIDKELTEEEYAKAAEEQKADVKKRLVIAEIISDFLAKVGLDKQYHVAREYQVFSLFEEMIPLIKLVGDEADKLKRTVYTNIFMKYVPDQRAFIRDIKTLIKSNMYVDFLKEQDDIINELMLKYNNSRISTKTELDAFAADNDIYKEKLLMSFKSALEKGRSKNALSKPSEYLNKCIEQMMNIDSRIFAKLNDEEKADLKNKFDTIIQSAESFKSQL